MSPDRRIRRSRNPKVVFMGQDATDGGVFASLEPARACCSPRIPPRSVIGVTGGVLARQLQNQKVGVSSAGCLGGLVPGAGGREQAWQTIPDLARIRPGRKEITSLEGWLRERSERYPGTEHRLAMNDRSGRSDPWDSSSRATNEGSSGRSRLARV